MVLLEEKKIMHSRMPVYNESIDNIVGILHFKDLFYSTKNKETNITKVMRTPFFVPESKPIDELFEELRKNRNLMAIVIDEYGGTSGIVTMEDILEEIVGEIYDEHDEVEELYKKLDDNTYIINAEMTIYDVEDILGIHIQEGDYDTLSGYIIEKMGRIPTENDLEKSIDTKDMIYTIEEIKDKHITVVKATKIEKKY